MASAGEFVFGTACEFPDFEVTKLSGGKLSRVRVFLWACDYDYEVEKECPAEYRIKASISPEEWLPLPPELAGKEFSAWLEFCATYEGFSGGPHSISHLEAVRVLPCSH